MTHTEPTTVHAASTTGDRTPLRRRRARWIVITTCCVVSATALVALPAVAADGAATPNRDRVVVCESGVTGDGEVRTSAAVATRAAAGDALLEGCREG